MENVELGINIGELIKAIEIVKSEDPAGDIQVRRRRALDYLRKLLIDEILKQERRFK